MTVEDLVSHGKLRGGPSFVAVKLHRRSLRLLPAFGVLPRSLTRIQPRLTPLAAFGFVIRKGSCNRLSLVARRGR
jgi:hypothetical protein